MKKSRYTEEQIAFTLKQAETGTPVAEVIRRMGISEQTFYRRKKVYVTLSAGVQRCGAVTSRRSGIPVEVCLSNPVQLIYPKRFGDARGWFTEVYSVPAFVALGIDCTFVQDNHSLSVPAFTLRGLHFQTPPRGQDKLVRCIRGRIYDVAVDVRKGSPTYGHWVGAELSAENGHQLFIPIGFAHGFVTLEPDCEVTYKCSDTYAPEADGGIRWDSVGIDWPLPAGMTLELSEKDKVQPPLADFDSPFAYDGCPLAPLT